jgi:hypothetical protein
VVSFIDNLIFFILKKNPLLIEIFSSYIYRVNSKFYKNEHIMQTKHFFEN